MILSVCCQESEQNLFSAFKYLRGTAELNSHLHFSFLSQLAGFNQIWLLQHLRACKAGEKTFAVKKMCIGLLLICGIFLIPKTSESLIRLLPKKKTHILPTFNVFFNQNDFKAPFFLEFVRKYNGNLLKTSQRPPSDVSIGL